MNRKISKTSETAPGLELTQEEMVLINKHTQRELSAGEVFAFRVTLCDNQVDRDRECFPTASLHKLAELYVGKPGIFDHSPKAAGQTARIYAAEAVEDPERDSNTGEPYARLAARAYMLRDDSTMATIRSIEAGILKEVCVGCAVDQITCSVCGKSQRGEGCIHRKGSTYDGAPCYHLLENPTDAFEWSFVAVPAQPGAGVTKSVAKTANADLEGLEMVKMELLAAKQTVEAAIDRLDNWLAQQGSVGAGEEQIPPDRESDEKDRQRAEDLIKQANRLTEQIKRRMT